jgi:hypothetical protein
MVVDRAWEEMPIVKTKKGKDATATLMDANFWKGVTLCLKSHWFPFFAWLMEMSSHLWLGFMKKC